MFQKGFSLIELLMAVFIGGVLLLAGNHLMVQFSARSQDAVSSENLAVYMDRALNYLERELYNAVAIIPAEGLYTSEDGLYRGVAAVLPEKVGAAQLAKLGISNCRQEIVDNKERFTLLRYTMIDSLSPTGRLTQSWDEASINAQAVKIREIASALNPKPLFTEDSREVLLTDADSVNMRRYLTRTEKRGRFPRGRFGQNEDEETFLEMTRTLKGEAQKPSLQRFITDSHLVVTKTKYICVDDNGRLMETSELPESKRVVLNLTNLGAQISEFEVRFLNTPSQARLDPTAFQIFPHLNFAKSQCVNSALIRLRIQDKNRKFPQDFDRLVLIRNHHLRRPFQCL